MDTFSNILFVKDQLATLSHLAHRAVETDKYRPETCLVVGNYYSLKVRTSLLIGHYIVTALTCSVDAK